MVPSNGLRPCFGHLPPFFVKTLRIIFLLVTKVKSKAIAFSIVLLCLVLGFSGGLVTANPGLNTVTLYLHKDAAVGTVNTKGTAGQIFNTTTSWSGGTQENSSALAARGNWSVYFYLYPTLAGALTFSGSMTVIPFIKANDTVADVVLSTTLNAISVAGVSTLISTKSNSSVAVGLAYAEKLSPHSPISATVASGSTLELNITLGNSTSKLTYSVGYDTAVVDSRITLAAEDAVTVSLSSDFLTYERDDAACLTATVTDVFGGYDIASSPSVLFTNPFGLSYTLAASSYGDTQYSNTYFYTISKLSVVGQAGTWTPTVTTTDRSGNSFTSSYSFVVTTEPGARNWDPDLPPLSWTGSPSGDASVVVVVLIVAVCGSLLWYGTKKPRRRR